MSLSKVQILRLIKQYSRHIDDTQHVYDLLEELRSPIINHGVQNEITIDLAKQAKHVISLEDDITIDFDNFPDGNELAKVIIITLYNNEETAKTITWDGLDGECWAEEISIVSLPPNKKALVSILTCEDTIEINYLIFNLS